MEASPIARTLALAGGLLAVLLALGLAGAPSAHAQPSLLDVAVDVEDPQGPLEPGNETLLDVTVENQGTTNATARLEATAQGQGWHAEMETDQVQLEPGEAARVTLRVTAPATRNGTAPGTDALVRATLSETTGQFTATDQDTTHVALTDPESPAPESNGWLIPGGLSAGALLVSGIATWRVVSKKEQLEVELPGEATVREGEEARVRVTVRNPTDEPQDVDLHLEDIPEGWPAALGTSHLTVSAREHADVWLSIAPHGPPGICPVHVRIAAQPVDGAVRPAAATVKLRLEDADTGTPGSGLPPNPTSRGD